MRKKSFTIQLDKLLLEQIKNLAQSNHISISAQISLLISHQINQSCMDISIKEKTN